MFDKKEILARLANGEDAQAIANELADTLNSAIAEHMDAQEKKKENSVKANAVGAIMTSILDFLEKYYPDIYDEDLRDFDNNDLLEMVEAAVEETRKLSKAMKGLDQLLSDIERVNNSECKCEKKSMDPIEEFLAKYVN